MRMKVAPEKYCVVVAKEWEMDNLEEEARIVAESANGAEFCLISGQWILAIPESKSSTEK
jgi:hypothetical protein